MNTITRIDLSRSSGMWVSGTAGEYRFVGLVFADHADNQEWELAGSRISRLWIQHQSRTVFNWDRDMDIDTVNDEVQDLVVPLCSELPMLQHKLGDRIRILAMDDLDPVPAGTLGTARAFRFHDGWL